MASGIQPVEECTAAFGRLHKREIKYIIYKIAKRGNKPEIVVDKESSKADFDKFLGDLPPNECRMGVFDFQYNIGEGLRSKVLFVLWSPDDATVLSKMTYSTSKSTLHTVLGGFFTDIQANDADTARRNVEEKLGPVFN